MKNRVTIQTLRDLDLKALNEILVDIYRELNRIADSADEITFKRTKEGNNELVINDKGREYVDVSNLTRFSANLYSNKQKVQKNLKKDLSLDKVTNESKTTMFTNPSVSGSTGITHSGNLPFLANTNQYYFAGGDTGEDTTIQIRAGGVGNHAVLSLNAGASKKFLITHNQGDDNKLNFYGDTTGDNVASTSDTVAMTLTGAGALTTTSTVTSSNGVCSGTGALDTGSSNITTTGTITGGSFVGQSVWVEYPFVVTNGVAGRPYYRDVDDLYGDFRKWDDYDTSPTAITRGDVSGHYVVPENCTLKHMRALVLNATSSEDIIIAIYHGTPNLNTASATTLALAGSENTVSISTSSYNYATNVDFDVDLDAGDIIVPMVEHNFGTGNQTFRGNITLKLITS